LTDSGGFDISTRVIDSVPVQRQHTHGYGEIPMICQPVNQGGMILKPGKVGERHKHSTADCPVFQLTNSGRIALRAVISGLAKTRGRRAEAAERVGLPSDPGMQGGGLCSAGTVRRVGGLDLTGPTLC
jgi:hypothetical protein